MFPVNPVSFKFFTHPIFTFPLNIFQFLQDILSIACQVSGIYASFHSNKYMCFTRDMSATKIKRKLSKL
jgi:hypothetical protein